jgi:hypothetical protein
MKHKLSRISVFFGASGLLAAGLAPGAYAATTAAAQTPSWHTVLSVPTSAEPNSFEMVVATGRTSGWAFLQNGTSAYERTGATTWKKVPFPGRNLVLHMAAGASSPSNVWASFYGAGEPSVLYHWNGQTWTAAKTLQTPLNSISVLGRDDVWVFGGGAFHFNGRTWTQVSSTVTSGSALSDNNVWAVNGTNVEYFNGRAWSATNVASLLPPTGNSPSTLDSILALAPNNVYATGTGERTSEGGTAGVLLHFNGRTWARVAVSITLVDLSNDALTSDGEGGVWIESRSFPGLFHYSGGQLTAANLGGASSEWVSRIPGTTEALSGGFSTSAAVVQQFS